jgi:hypothetical protein
MGTKGNVAATSCDTMSNYWQEPRLQTACTSADRTSILFHGTERTTFRDKKAPESALANCKVSMPCNINLQQHMQGSLAKTFYLRVSCVTAIMKTKAACRLAKTAGVPRTDTENVVQQVYLGHHTKGSCSISPWENFGKVNQPRCI